MTCQLRGNTPDAGVPHPDAAVDAPPPPTPPETTMVMHPPDATQSSTASFTFTSNQEPSEFECSLDGAAFAACTSPKTFDDLAEGSHTFAVRAKNGAVVDPTPATFTWKVDRTAPDTMITSGPSGDINTSEAAFAFTCDDLPCTFECKMDGGAFASCKSGDSFGGLTLGSHTFQVRATDLAGNVDPTPDSRTFNVNTITPQTTITDGPGAVTNKTDVSFSFVCIEANVEVPCTFVCSLDGAAAAACTSPKAYPGLAPGAHTFTVKGTNANHVPDPTEASYPFTIDVTRPVVTIVTKPGAVSGPSASFTYTANEPISLYECAIDDAFAPCPADGVTFDTLANGSRTFAVRVTDIAGNVSDPATFTWTVDAAGPVVTVTFPTTESGPSGTLTFTFLDLSPPVTFRCDFGTGFVPCDTGFAFSGLSDGEHTVTIEGTDKWNNKSTTTQTFAVDAIGPLVSIISPQDGSLTSGGDTGTFTVAPDAVRFTCAIDGAPVLPCQGGAFTFSGLASGPHTAVVTAFDKWDNPSASPGTVPWTVDADPPLVIIDSPANLQVVCPTMSVTFHAALQPDGSPDSGVRFTCALDNAPFLPCASGVTYNLTRTGNPHTVRVIGTDQVGNQSVIPYAQVMFTIDDFPPEGTVTPHSPPAGLPDELVCKDGFITWTASDTNHPTTGGAPTYVTGTCAVDGDIACTTNNAAGTNMLGFADLGNGGHAVALTIEDACHNRATLSDNFDVDRAPPTVEINTPGQAAVCFGTGPINYDTADAEPSSGNVTLVTASVDGTACAGATCDFLGGGTGGLEYINRADGSHPIVVTVHDRCDNQATATATVTVDLTAPDFAITQPTPAPTPASGGSGTVALSPLESGASMQSCVIDAGRGGLERSCATLTYTGLLDSDNSHTVDVTVVDLCKNARTRSVTFNVDTTPPSVTALAAANPVAGDGAFTIQASLSDASTIAHIFTRLDRAGAFSDRGGGTTVSQGVTELAAGEHVIEVYAVDQWGNSGQSFAEAPPPASHAVAFATESYPPNTGRLVVLGHDFSADPNAAQVALIGNAVNLAPFRQIPRAFTRHIKVVGWNGGAVATGERANALAAIQSRLGALGVPWTIAADYNEFTAATDAGLRDALFGNDVLVIFDQNDASPRMTTVGATWHARLRSFLEAGGVIVLLDGRLADNTTPSGTVSLVAATVPNDLPLLDAFALTDFPFDDSILQDDVAADHPLVVGTSYTTQQNTVGMDVDADTQQSTSLYIADLDCSGSECSEKGATVIDKIFPVYALATSVSSAPSGAHCPTGSIVLSVNPGSGVGFPAGATYTCNLDDAGDTACAPGDSIDYTTSQNQFGHSLLFRATDVNGNPGRFIRSSFGVDVFPPSVVAAFENQVCSNATGIPCPHPEADTCGTGQNGCTNSICCQDKAKAQTDNVYFHVAGPEVAGATFLCQFDQGQTAECLDTAGGRCTAPYGDCHVHYTNLSCGSHQLTISARDECVSSGGRTGTITFPFFIGCIN